MLGYWLVFFIFSYLALHFRPVAFQVGGNLAKAKLGLIHILVIFLLTLFIGLRFEIGGDWDVYIEHFDRIKRGLPLDIIGFRKELGHFSINKFVSNLNLSFVYVNVIYAFIFTIGLVSFSLTQPRSWLVLVAAFPYLITVVAMGYSRQAVAIGFFFLGFVQLREGKTYHYSFFILLAASFHSTAAILLPLAAIISKKNKVLNFALTFLVVIILYNSILADKILALNRIYVENKTQSDGAAIRVTMNLLPALILILFRKYFVFNHIEKRVWLLFAYAAIFMPLILILTPFSTAVDRISLYLLPIQLVVFAHLPDLFGKRNHRNIYIVLLIIVYFFLIQFVWLNFANHAEHWLPYRMKLI